MDEIYTAVQNGCHRLAAMGVGALLESVITQKIGDKGTFKGNVDALLEAGYVSVRQALTIQSILDAGHASIHRGWEPTNQDVNTLLDIVESIVETVYLHEDLVRELDKKVPKRKRPNSDPRNV